MDGETKILLQKQKEQVRKLMAELHGKTMDYETCSMLEEFFNDYTNLMLENIETQMLKIKEKYDLVLKKKEVLG